MRRLWKNKAASAAVAIMIAASMFSGSLTTAWAEGEVEETTSEEMPTYEAPDDSATEEEPVVDKEEDGDKSEEADQGGAKDDADASADDGEAAEGEEADGGTAEGEEADGETAEGKEADGETAEGKEADGEALDDDSSDEAADAADAADGEEDEENADDETEDETEDEEDGNGRTPDITAGTSYSSDTTISGKTIQGIVNVEDDTTVIFENCTFIGSEDDGTGEMGVSVSGDGVAVLKNATFIVMEEEIDDDGISTVGDEHTLSFSNVFNGGKVGENGSTTATYPCEAEGLTVDGIDYEEILSVAAGDLSIDQDYDTELTYTISYTPDDSGYNVTHSTTMEFELNTIEFPTVLNVEAGGPAEQGDPEGPPTDSGDGITPKRTITVEKKWKNAEKYYDHSKLHVFVKILDSNGKEIGEVELNKDNRWTATFPAKGSSQTLDMDAEYSVEEYKILNGDGEDVTKGYVVVDRQEKNRYSYSRTDEIKVGGTYILGYTLDGNASYQLMSSDGSRIKTTKVPAKTWTDIEPSDTFYWNTLAPSQDGYNNNDSFWNFQHKSTGGYVHGSEDDFSMSSKSTPIKYYARQFRFNYGEIVNEYSMYSHDASGNCTKIAMDGAQIYPIVYSKDTLFTLTNQECFYVYHSSDCITERYMLRDDLTDKEAGTFDIVRLVRSKHFYGGYFKSYADEGTPYTGASSKWNFDEAYTTSGFRIVPAPGTTYYLKEVPYDYLRPRVQNIKLIANNKYSQLAVVTVLDDNNYRSVGFDGKGFDGNPFPDIDVKGNPNPADTLYTTVNLTGAVNKKYPATYYIPAVPAGVIDFYQLFEDLEPKLPDGTSYTVTPYLVTPDNIKVWLETRTYELGDNGTKLTRTYTSEIVTHFLENAIDKVLRPIIEDNGFNIGSKSSNSNNTSNSSQSSNQSSSNSSSGNNSSGSSAGSSGNTVNGSTASNTDSSNTANTGESSISKTSKGSESNQEGSASEGSNNQSGTDPNTSMENEKQAGNAQQDGNTWTDETDKMNTGWIWPVAAVACGFIWFIIWKRREKEDEEGPDL